MELRIAIAPELAQRVRLGTLLLEGVTVKPSDPALVAEIDAYGRELRTRHAGLKSGDVPGTEDARSLYKALGLDPTKTRPSNEALLRRVLKGEALYTINTLVDALNLVSLKAQLPFSVYDAPRIEPPVTFRKGLAGESYEGIRKAPVGAFGKPVLADARGPFGNPTSDSARTCVTLETTTALVVAYAPARATDTSLNGILELTAATLTRHVGGSAGERMLL